MLDVSDHSFEAGGWSTEGLLGASAAGTLYADTGPLAAGIYTAHCVWASRTASNLLCEFQHRNAANNATLKSQVFNVYYTLSGIFQVLPAYQIALNERLRVVSYHDIDSWMQASIIWIRRYS